MCIYFEYGVILNVLLELKEKQEPGGLKPQGNFYIYKKPL